MKLNTNETTTVERWNFKHLYCALGIVAILHALFLPCLCAVGMGIYRFSIAVDLLFLARIVVAHLRLETGRDWIVYSWFIWTSPIWIELVSTLVVGGH